MEDEERQRKLEAGKAKLAEYRQRKAQGDGQKKQKKKKKKKGSEDECVREEEPDPPTQQEERKDTPTTEVSFTKTLRSGETVKHDQMYTLEPESEVSTTAEDYSSEDEELCDPLSPLEPELLPDVEEDVVASRSQAEEDVVTSRSQAEEVLSRGLEEIRGVLEAEDVQQLQDFEAALKQRDGIITQLTTNLQQARAEKDEVMREFLELTEQSQKLQLQFQQLQAGESLRSSSISSAAADLHQTRQQLTLYQQQLQEKNTQIRAQHTQLGEGETLLQDLHKQLEEKDSQVKGLQEMMTMLQQKVSQLEMVTRETEESSAQEKDQQGAERERLSAEEQRELSQLREDLQASQRRFHDVSDQLAAKALELQDCEAELHASRQKERLSSTEIMQLMGTVEDMQKRHHKGSQSEGEVLQRAELDATRRLEHLRAELDEMYGQQIVQMKQELLARHSEEMAHVLDLHSINMEKTMEDHRLEMEHMRAQWSQSTGEVNVLNARLVDVQQRLQETQVLREKAEQDLTQVSAEKLWMQEQVQEHGGVGQKRAEQSQAEVERLLADVSLLQAQLASAEHAWGELEARREEEVTNYQIKLEMMEREKDAVLDRMAESQEAELERLRTQLLFSHEEELSRLREDLQRESQMNVENLRDELERRHCGNVLHLRTGYEERLRAAEDQRDALLTDKDSLLQEIATLKSDLSHVEEVSRVEELVQQLGELHAEVEELRLRACESVEGSQHRTEVMSEAEERWESSVESENKLLKDTNAAMAEELKSRREERDSLLKKVEALAIDNKQVNEVAEELRAEIKRLTNTFSFAEKNFDVNYQELKEEYASLTGEKAALEKQLQEQELQYTAKLCSLEAQLQPLHQGMVGESSSTHPAREEYEDWGRGTLVEKDTEELMEKLQRAEEEKLELVEKVEQKEVELGRVALERVGLLEQVQKMEAELLRVELEKAELKEQVEQKEVELQRVGLVEQEEAELKGAELEKVVIETAVQTEAELQPLWPGGVDACTQLDESPTLPGVTTAQDHRHITALELELQALHTALRGVERREGQMSQLLISPNQGPGVEPIERLLAPPLPQAVSGEVTAEEGRKREPGACAVLLGEKTLAHTEPITAADGCTHDADTLLDADHAQVQSRDVQQNGESESCPSVTRVPVMDGSEHEECRLQLEAQRISLCQIHSAQLELLTEGLPTHIHVQTHTHTQTQETQVQTTDDPKPSKYRRFMEEVTEDCSHLIQSFSRVLGEEVLESLQSHEEPVELSEHTLQRLETSSIRELLAEARELYLRLQQLNQCVMSSHQHLLELQTSLTTSAHKLGCDERMQREKDFQEISKNRPTLTRRREAMAGHVEQAEGQRADFQKQQEQHRQEVLRSDYSDHTREQEQHYTAELHLLQDRQLSTTHALCSMPSGLSPPPDKTEQSQGSPRQTNSLGHSVLQCPLLPGSQQEQCEEEPPEQDQQQCREEEIAKVIVQMAVEFAQQSELVRISRQDREISTSTQTLTPGGDIEQLLEQLRWREEELLVLRQKVEVLESRPAPREARVVHTQGVELTQVANQDEEGESGRPQYGSKQCSSTQTDLRGDEEEERGEMKTEEVQAGAVTSLLSSQDPGLSSDVTAERNYLRRANEGLRRVLVDVLKTTVAVEETIGRHVEGILHAASRGQQPMTTDASTESYRGNETVADDSSLLSGETETDEGFEMSHVMMGVELQMEREEHLMSISTRLHSAVEKLLVAITETSNQLEHARVTQTELMREKFRHGEEMAELLRRQDELQERLKEEEEIHQQLTLQLHQAEGLIDGYSGERRALEEQLRERERLQVQLEQELQVTRRRLSELEQERQNLYNQQELLARQQDAMRERAGAPELCIVDAAGGVAPEADLLEETEKLMKEKVDVERQAEKEHAELLQQVRQLEVELEEQVGHAAELENIHRLESADLTQQINALEKQLDHNRRFLDEQAVDREHERDVFQQEIHKLEQQLKNLPKPPSSKEEHHREVEELRAALLEKVDCCSELVLRSEQLQRDVDDRNEEMEKLGTRVRELEQALLTSTDALHREEETTQYASMAGKSDVALEALLQTEREALDRKEKEIVNLEEQLEQFREELQNKSEEVQQLHMQLEIQKKEINTQQQQLVAQGNLQMVLEEKDREVALLNEQITKLQPQDTRPDNKEVEERGELVRELEAQVEYLRGEQERLKRDSQEEVEQLNSVIEKLQEELSHIEHKQSSEEEEQKDNSHGDEEEYDELKQKLDETIKELNTLKADHCSLLSKYECLQVEMTEREKRQREMEREEEREREEEERQREMEREEEERQREMERQTEMERKREEEEREAEREEERQREMERKRLVAELEEAVRDRTAALVVVQAQVQALEQSAESRVTNLNQRVEELEQCVEEKELELKECRLEVEKAQVDAETLHLKVCQLEEKLREKVAAVLVTQAQLEAVQVQTKELRSEAQLSEPICALVDSSAELEVENLRAQAKEPRVPPPGTEGPLIEKLQELEEALNSMQRNQEFQKQLLTSSEEEVQEYEKRLAVLMELLNKMRFRPVELAGGGPAQEHAGGGLVQELHEVKGQAAATKEELKCCKEHSQKLQDELQEREMAITLLKDQLHRTSGEVDNSELLQELQKVKDEAAVTKEELNSYIERNLKLQEEIQGRDASITELVAELQLVRAAAGSGVSEAAQGQLQTPSQQRAGRDLRTTDQPALPQPGALASASASVPTSAADADDSEGVTCVDVGTQVELSEELEVVINEYRERIEQMQDLHAAEIMDMENRHISESENLRRDAQRLEQECSVLRTSISSLRGSEIARLEHPTGSQFRDGYASDSSSDWSQRTGFEHLQAEFRSTPEGARRDDADPLPDRVKTLLREVHQEGMQVLSLSELTVPEGGPSGTQLPLQAWRKERDALIDTVESLKVLITQLQSHSGNLTHAQAGGDWRADLLRAVQQVFLRERDVLRTTLLSHMDLLDTSDVVIHLNQLQRLLSEQDSRQQQALASLQAAERSSLLAEISQLRAHLQHPHQDTQLTLQQHHTVAGTGVCETWPAVGGAAVGPDSLGTGRGAGAVLPEPSPALELNAELAQTRLELELALKSKQKYMKELDTLRYEASVKAQEQESLSERLVKEQRRVRELQWVVERETSRAERRREGEREEVEDLRLALEEQQSRVSELTASLEEERRVLAQLREDRSGEFSPELQVKLEAQKAQIVELSSALQRETELSTQMMKQLQHPDSSTDPQRPLQGVEQAEASCSQVEEGVRSVEALLQTLQEQLTEKHAALMEVMGQLEQHKLKAVQAKRAWEQERDALSRTAAQDCSALQGSRESLARLQTQLDGERERGKGLEEERERLQQRVCELTERLEEVEQSTQSRARAQQEVLWNADRPLSDRTRDWVLQQEAGDNAPPAVSSPHTGHAPATPTHSQNLDNVIARLQLIATKINSMAGHTDYRLSLEGPDGESLTWLQSNVQDVMSLLQQVPSVPPAVLETVPLLTGGSSSALTERLLRQNAELTGFVSRLTEEKNELRNQLLRLEEQLRRQRHLAAQGSSTSGSGEPERFSSEREAWTQERSRLEKSLRQAESELSHLRGEIRSSTERELSAPDTDNAVLKRIYGKYLRAESFRKALIYQKKYLLLLLGGFQECEEATLSLIGRMGGRPTHPCLELATYHRRGLMRFRSAVRVSIALSRMRFLVRRWQKASGGSISSPSINRNGLNQTPGGDGRNDTPYLHPVSVDAYGERRGTNQGRTGRDSPRSGHSTLHRYGGAATDGGALLCSHLQNYDPDRALTDYISRLEALQRRLGSVQSGPSSYAQLQFGVRR